MKKNFLLLGYTIFTILFVITAMLWIAVPESTGIVWLSTGLLLSLVLVIGVGDRTQWIHVAKSGKFKYLVNVVVSVMALLGIFGLANYLSFKNPFQIDVTRKSRNSLATESQQILAKLESPLEIMVIAKRANIPAIMLLLDLYRFGSKQIKISTFDSELRPDLINKYEITAADSLVLRYNERDTVAYDFSEKTISNAIVRLSRTNDPIIYYVTDLGTGSILSDENEGFSAFQHFTRIQQYTFKNLSLLQTKKIPTDAAMVMLWGPKSDLGKTEVKVLSDYIIGGGKVAMAIDPNVKRKTVQPALNKFLFSHGLAIENGLVIDKKNHINGSGGIVPIATGINAHAINKGFKGTLFFPLANHLNIENLKLWKPLYLSNSSPYAWLEKDLSSYIKNGKVGYSEGQDIKGPLVFGAIGKIGDGEILLFSNSSFISNAYKRFQTNIKVMGNGIGYLTKNTELISFDSSALKDKPIFMGNTVMRFIFFLCVIGIPLFYAGSGTFLFFKRRRA